MQGGPEVRRQAVSDLAQEPGEGSLHQTAGGQSGDGLERRRICCDGPLTLSDAKACSSRLEERLPACTLSYPHPGELSGGWGEFEGFQESSAKSEQFSQSFELLGRAAEHQPLRTPSIPKEHGSCQVQQGGPWVTGTAAGPSSESILSCEEVFRFAFQEVPVEWATEDICSLDRFLGISSERNAGLAPVPRLCSESRKLWRALQNTDPASASRCLWSESHCRENLLPVLGVDAAQKSLSGGQGHILEGSDLRKPEELLAVSSFRLHHCKALIQTKGEQACLDLDLVPPFNQAFQEGLCIALRDTWQQTGQPDYLQPVSEDTTTRKRALHHHSTEKDLYSTQPKNGIL